MEKYIVITIEQRIMLLARFANVAVYDNNFSLEMSRSGIFGVNRYLKNENGEFKYQDCKNIYFDDKTSDMSFVERYNEAVDFVNKSLPEDAQMKPIAFAYEF